MRKLLLGWILALPLAASAAPDARPGFEWDAVRLIAIQDRGRLKPLETFANESVLYITGKRGWNGMSPVQVLFGWLVAFEQEWDDEPFVRVDHNPLKKALGLEVTRNYFTPAELRDLPALGRMMSDVVRKERNKERLTETEKKGRQLQGQRGLLDAIAGGEAMTILPHPGGLQEAWPSLAAITTQQGLPYAPEKMSGLAERIREVLDSYLKKDAARWNPAARNLALFLRNDLVPASAYPPVKDLEVESHYNNLRPFRLSWILYALAFVLLAAGMVTRGRKLEWAGMGALLVGFGVHVYGFALRMMIAGRPPVTNMYESVIWVSWGCVLFALIVWGVYRKPIIPTASAVFAVASLVLADGLPSVLDPGIHPLEPVLRSNFWLTIHVLTITLSYAAFAVALCLGNVVLGNFLWRPTHTAAAQEYSLYMYRAVQIGVVLLAAGTILGGVWADYSWGRFWGWDPKEVWALVALLLYLAVLHGRFTGWLRGFGFAAATVLCFLGVLMAWYGVNFVLGVGLHSYGFGTGGMFWVSLYVGGQLAFIGGAWLRYNRAKAIQSLDQAIFPRGTGIR